MLKRQQILSSIVLLLGSGAFCLYNLAQMEETELSIHPLFLPTVILALIFLLSLIRLIGGLRMAPSDNVPHSISIPKRSLLTMLLIVVYALLFKRLGFVLDTFVYLMLQMVLLKDGKRNYLLMLLIAVIGSAGVYALFVYGFNVMLPAGILSWT